MSSQSGAKKTSDVGLDPRMLGQAIETFRAQQAAGAFPGGQFVVRRFGKPIISEALGCARGCAGREEDTSLSVQPDTPFPAYSCGKPLAAIAVAMLEDRGRLDPNSPVADGFPEFGRCSETNRLLMHDKRVSQD